MKTCTAQGWYFYNTYRFTYFAILIPLYRRPPTLVQMWGRSRAVLQEWIIGFIHLLDSEVFLLPLLQISIFKWITWQPAGHSSHNGGSLDPATDYIAGLVQERCNSIANALGLHLSCTNPSVCDTTIQAVIVTGLEDMSSYGKSACLLCIA